MGEIKEVLNAITKVQAELAKSGIAKDQENTTQHFKFRGIDDVYNALAPLLAKVGLVILPTVKSRTCTERPSRSGGTLFHVVLDVNYELVAALDNSCVTVCVVSEAMDSGDKATSKALSMSYKTMAFQVFCIPVENREEDPDSKTHEVKSSAPAPEPKTFAPKPQASPQHNDPPKPLKERFPDAEICTGSVLYVGKKSGEKNGKPWTQYSVKIDEEYYTTFSDTDGGIAQKFKGRLVEFTWKPAANPKYKNLTGIQEAAEEMNPEAFDPANYSE